jgi:hypothetical protein
MVWEAFEKSFEGKFFQKSLSRGFPMAGCGVYMKLLIFKIDYDYFRFFLVR